MSPNQNTRQGYYGSDEARDFQSFENGSGRGDLSNRSGGKASRKRKKPLSKKQKLLLMIGGAALLVVLLVTVIVLLLSGGDDITYDNTSYLVYTDEKGEYHVLVNGDEVEHEFHGDVELIPARDRSFAYVLDRTSSGVRIYVLDGTDMQRVAPKPVDDVVAFADLEPGVIYLRDNAYMFFSEEAGEHSLAKEDEQAPKNFMISGDASTVIYSATDPDNSKEYLYIFYDETNHRTRANLTPVAVSNYGDYVYACGVVKGEKLLIHMDPKNPDKPLNVPDSTGFDDSRAPILNAEGDEILYYTAEGYTMLYQAVDGESHTIGRGILTPVIIDPDIAVPETFKKSYLMGEDPSAVDSTEVTYFVSKKYEGSAIANFHGKFSPDGDYFYYVNRSGTLIQMDLTDDTYPKKSLGLTDVVDFVITEKGNIYSLNDNNELYFRKVSSGKNTSLSWDATEINFYSYANTLFFAEKESENLNVWSSEEGSNQEKVKMDKIQITKVPFFSHPNSKRCYVYYVDPSSGNWQLYYTKNGKSYDLLADRCTDIYLDGVRLSDR